MEKEMKIHPMRKNYSQILLEKPYKVVALALVLILMATFAITRSNSSFTTKLATRTDYTANATPTQLEAILHYTTSLVVPQQSLPEITLTFNVLKSIAPCNFLVFGLGHDSLMWASLNPRGNTIFLEEDPQWVQSIVKRAPNLRAHVVKYRTRLYEADELLLSYKRDEHCKMPNLRLKGNVQCKLALSALPDEVYDTEWDVIMIDAPRGYFDKAPGRMGAIYSAAVMVRARTRPCPTHVYLHDVNRRVERIYAEEFLCLQYRVKSVGRLWHFEIPSSPITNTSNSYSNFC